MTNSVFYIVALMIVSVLNKCSGFFSQFFFVMNHYIYCKKNNINFVLDSSQWLHKFQHGWTDYFQCINCERQHDCSKRTVGYNVILDNYSLHEYKNIILEMYVYNENTLLQIEKYRNKFGLNRGQYDGIFIRRGDKLINESVYIHGKTFVDVLLNKNPNCTDIFVQTDDYFAFLEIKQHIEDNYCEHKINLHTICEPERHGFVVLDDFETIIKNTDENTNLSQIKENDEYMLTLKNDLKNTIPVSKFTPNQLFEHTMDMIVGIDILLNSNVCVCDYQSNVGRFVKLAHPCFENVFNVLSPNKELDLNHVFCPAYSNEVF